MDCYDFAWDNDGFDGLGEAVVDKNDISVGVGEMDAISGLYAAEFSGFGFYPSGSPVVGSSWFPSVSTHHPVLAPPAPGGPPIALDSPRNGPSLLQPMVSPPAPLLSSSAGSPLDDANNNPPFPSFVVARAAYGKGAEGKNNAPHRLDNYAYLEGISYQTLAAILVDPETGRVPRNSEMFKAFRKLVEGLPVDRACKRRLANMYGWLDEHWDSIGEKAVLVFCEVFGK